MAVVQQISCRLHCSDSEGVAGLHYHMAYNLLCTMVVFAGRVLLLDVFGSV
jgi:hypothetical protein